MRHASNQVLKQYVYGARYVDNPVQIGVNQAPTDDPDFDPEDEDHDPAWYWPIQDANFNVVGLVDSGGDLVERYEYTPYGQRTVFVPSGSNDKATSAPLYESQRVNTGTEQDPNWAAWSLCDIGHQGLFLDKEIGLYDNYHRVLHPRFGRFMQRDPIGYADGMGLYEYAASNPCGLLDPSGTQIVVLSGGSGFIQSTLRALKALCPCFDGKGGTSAIKAIGNEIGLKPVWGKSPFDPQDSDAQLRFCCKCYLPKKGISEPYVNAWRSELQRINARLQRELVDPANKYRKKQLEGYSRLQEDIGELVNAVDRALAGAGYRGRVTGCNLVWEVLVERTIELAKGSNHYDDEADIVFWDGNSQIGLGHELKHGTRGGAPFRGREGMIDKARKQLEAGGPADEREVVRGAENPLRFEAGMPLRTDTHKEMAIISKRDQLWDPRSLIVPSKPRWCHAFDGYESGPGQ